MLECLPSVMTGCEEDVAVRTNLVVRARQDKSWTETEQRLNSKLEKRLLLGTSRGSGLAPWHTRPALEQRGEAFPLSYSRVSPAACPSHRWDPPAAMVGCVRKK